MAKYILAIDQGTTSTRMIIFDKEQKIVASSQKEVATFYPHDGWVEADANEIYLSVIYCLGQLFQKTHIDPGDILAIGITNQRETTVMWNKKTGLPIYNAIIWQSRQTDDIVARHKAAGHEKIIQEKTGLILDPYFSASKIEWLYENVIDDDRDLLFGTIDTWLLWKLSGGKVHATDASNASRTSLFDIRECKWDSELCDLFNIPMRILPEVKNTSELFGYTDPTVFFNIRCPIMALVGDQQAALFGESCFKKGDIKNTYGTGGFILVNTEDDLVFSRKGLLSTVAWSINGKVDYALEGSIFVSGSLIQWLRDGLHIIESAKDTETMARSIKDDGGVVIVPAFVGLGAPYWDEMCRGTIFGLTRGTSKEHIVRAALEAMAFQVKDLTDVIKEEISTEVQMIKVDGGASANDFLLQFQSDLLNIKVNRPNINEATALGAARLAGLACGFYHMADFTDDDETIFTPKDVESADALYERWKNAVIATRRFAHSDDKKL